MADLKGQDGASGRLEPRGKVDVSGSYEIGVQGRGTRIGVQGESPRGLGVEGNSDTFIGILGTSLESYGVIGFGGFAGMLAHNTIMTARSVYLATQFLAGDFYGDVEVHGVLTKFGGGLFKIDHPLDPANKYLSHSSVESPDMKNIYDGIVELNGNGEAVVKLPDWFDALNMNCCYQITSIGVASPNLYIAEEVNNNQFKIAGGMPQMKVSWQVTGIRRDAWANANRMAVEEEKPTEERGYYAHPQLYGQPEEKSVRNVNYPEKIKIESDAKDS